MTHARSLNNTLSESKDDSSSSSAGTASTLQTERGLVFPRIDTLAVAIHVPLSQELVPNFSLSECWCQVSTTIRLMIEKGVV